MLILYPNVSYSVQLCMLKDCLRDLFHVYLNKFEFHFLQLHKTKFTLAFSYLMDVSLLWPNRHNGYLKPKDNFSALKTPHPTLFK